MSFVWLPIRALLILFLIAFFTIHAPANMFEKIEFEVDPASDFPTYHSFLFKNTNPFTSEEVTCTPASEVPGLFGHLKDGGVYVTPKGFVNDGWPANVNFSIANYHGKMWVEAGVGFQLDQLGMPGKRVES